MDRLTREEHRLLDAYQTVVITLDELSERRVHLEQRRRALIVQQEQAERLRRERFRAQEVLASLTAFCERSAWSTWRPAGVAPGRLVQIQILRTRLQP